jgi:hypothetical protein
LKIKIYLLICIVIIPFFDPVIGYENNIEEKNQINLIENEIKNFDSIPIWEIGDSWKYRINEIVLINEDLKNPINVEFGESILTLSVIGISDDYYNLDFETKLYGIFELTISNYNIKLFGKFNILRPLKAHGTVFIDNKDLSIRGLTLYLSGLFKINFADRLLFTLPFPIDLCIELRAEPGLKIFKFPLIVENIYGLPSFNITIDGDISSPWFRIIKIVNSFTKLFGNPLLSDEFSEFLPRIDFGEILKWYSGDNTYYVNNLTWYDVPVFAVESFENITTEAGTYESYKILFPFDMGSIYYAPEVGNMIKLILNPITTMELIETTF